MRAPTADSPHYPFWKHIASGGAVFRADRLGGKRQWLLLADLGGNASEIRRFGFLDLSIPPDGATDYVDDGFDLRYYKRFSTNTMNLLAEWRSGEWHVAGTLPWTQLQPVPGSAQPIEAPSADQTQQEKSPSTPLTVEHENAILKAALFGDVGVMGGIAKIARWLGQAPPQTRTAPDRLSPGEADLWRRAQDAAYRTALDLLSIDAGVRELEHSHPTDARSQIHDGPVRPGDVFRAATGDSVTVLENLPGGIAQVRVHGKSLRLGDYRTAELKALPRIGRATYADGTYSTPDWMYADGARARIKDLTAKLTAAQAKPPVAEFPDWRVADGCEQDIADAASGTGRLELIESGWGAALKGTTPNGKHFALHVEFDANVPRFSVYPTGHDAVDVTSEEPVVNIVIVDGAAIVSNGYGPTAHSYSEGGKVEECDRFCGEEAMRALRESEPAEPETEAPR